MRSERVSAKNTTKGELALPLTAARFPQTNCGARNGIRTRDPDLGNSSVSENINKTYQLFTKRAMFVNGSIY